MYKFLILTFLLSCAVTSFAQVTLTKRSDVSANVYLHHIHFASDNITGYAVGSGGALWSTKDGGITWSSQISSVSSTLIACYATSPVEAWAVGAEGVIIRTTNGSTWDTLPGQSSRNEALYDITWYNGVGHIIATCGARYQYNGTFLQKQPTHTQESYRKFFTNESNLFGLLSNSKINQIGLAVDLGIPDAAHVADMATLGDALYFLDQEGSTIIRTENNTVSKIPTPSNTVSNIYVMNDSTIVLGGKAGECFVRQNGGSTWTNHASSNIKGHITAFHQVANDKVLFTTSMGEIWELKICDRQYSTTSISSCYDEPITIGGVSYVNVDTVVIDTLLSINACDSVVTYALSFRPQASSTIDTILCSGSSVSIGPELFDINRPSGQVVLPAASSFGCDSTILVNVSFFSTTKTDTLQVFACQESPYLWPQDGKTYTQPGSYTVTLVDNNGCPYENRLVLSHHSVPMSTIDTTICSDGALTIGSEIFDFNRPTGQVVLPAASSYGCDSTIQVNLSFVPCDTTECDFVLAKDSLVVQKNQSTFYNVLDNDQLPASYTWRVTKVSKEKSISYEYDDTGEITFTITGDFSEPIIVSYEVCTEDCECKSSTFTIQNEALEDIILTNVFIPNSSGKNSTLRFTNENESLRDSELLIFNRNGDRIFYMKDYDNSWNADGFPGGIYYYVLKARGETIKKTLTIFK